MLSIRRLIWDPGNVAHIARHRVIPGEVEEVCYGEPVVQAGKHGRLLAFGLTQSGRMLTVVLGSTETTHDYYVVTARPASRRERQIYRTERG